MKIFYGSQSGTAEGFAFEMEKEARQYFFDAGHSENISFMFHLGFLPKRYCFKKCCGDLILSVHSSKRRIFVETMTVQDLGLTFNGYSLYSEPSNEYVPFPEASLVH